LNLTIFISCFLSHFPTKRHFQLIFAIPVHTQDGIPPYHFVATGNGHPYVFNDPGSLDLGYWCNFAGFDFEPIRIFSGSIETRNPLR